MMSNNMKTMNGRVLYLDEENYISWKLWIANLLAGKELLMVSSKELNIKACSIARQYMDESFQMDFQNIDNIQELLQEVDEYFSANHVAKNAVAESYLNQFIWMGTDIQENYKRFKEYKMMYQGTGGVRSNIVYGLNFMQNAPECYRSTVNPWIAMGTCTLIQVYSGLRNIEASFEKSVRGQEFAKAKTTALFAKEKAFYVQDDRKPKFKGKEQRECFYCKKKGHLKKDCFKWKRDNDQSNGREHIGYAFSANDCGSLGTNVIAILDSGATSHIVNGGDLSNIRSANNKQVSVANGEILLVKCVADAIISEGYKVSDALVIPEMKYNLLSVSALTKKGFQVKFHGGTAIIAKGNKMIIEAKEENGLYVIKSQFDEKENCLASIETWHNRLGHCNKAQVKELVKHADGMVIGIDSDENCETCNEGKIKHRRTSKTKTKTVRQCGDLFHTDGLGPITPIGKDGSRHVYSYIDHKSGYTVSRPVKEKSEQHKNMVEIRNWVKNSSGRRIKQFRCDNGGEYISTESKDWALEKGIELQFTTRYRPQENGVAERWNATLMDMVRCLLIQSGISKIWWSELVLTATYIRNRCIKTSEGKTPFELWHGSKPDISNLRIIGCKVIYHIPRQLRGKLDNKGNVGILLGYDESNSQAYKVIDFATRNLIRTSDCTFMENQFPFKNDTVVPDIRQSKENDSELIDWDSGHDGADIDDGENSTIDGDQIDETIDSNAAESNRSRSRARTVMYGRDEYIHFVGLSIADNVPNTYEEAMACDEKDEWVKAMKQEYESLQSNNTWTLVDTPKDTPVIQSRWIYTKKYNSDGSLQRYKARFVAKGFSQVLGINYSTVFSPTASLALMRIVLTLAVNMGWKVMQGDVKTAFLESKLDEDIYIELPKGFTKGTKQVGKLLKALYGLKQASSAWHAHLKNVLKNLGFEQSLSESCLFFKKNILLLTYVDDFLIVGLTEQLLQELFMELKKNFTLTWGQAEWFLGFRIGRKGDTMYLDQHLYIDKILSKFKMTDCKVVRTPSVVIRNGTQENARGNEDYPYRDAIGCLLYLARGTRPDIMYAVAQAAQHVEMPTEENVIAVKRILRYIKGTKHYKFILRKGDRDESVKAYCDSDWGNALDRKSITGIIVYLWSCPIVWYSKKQPCVSTSTAESEYVALAKCTQELLWITQLLSEINIDVTIAVYEDNQACIQMVKNQCLSAKTKHVDIKLHFVRDVFTKDNFILEYIGTKEQRADSLTKSVCEKILYKFCTSIFSVGISY